MLYNIMVRFNKNNANKCICSELLVRVNDYSNSTEKNEHEGIKFLLIGFMKCIRNTISHNILSLNPSNALSIILQCNLLVNILEEGTLKNERLGCFSPELHSILLSRELDGYGIPVYYINDEEEDTE